MAIYCDRYRLCYFGPTKTGTISTVDWLARYGAVRQERNGRQHQRPGSEHPLHWRKVHSQGGWYYFTTCRNPFTRVPSDWSWLRWFGHGKFFDLGLGEYIMRYLGQPERWLLAHDIPNGLLPHFAAQVQWLGMDWVEKMRQVVRLENYEDDMRLLAAERGMPWTKPLRWNTLAGGEHEGDRRLKDEWVDRIKQVCRRDFDVFGYRKEPRKEWLYDSEARGTGDGAGLAVDGHPDADFAVDRPRDLGDN